MNGVKPDPQPRRRGRPDEGARDALLDAATELFIERDFDQVSTDEILARAGVSRGAMYHHFEGKTALFEAVYEASERRLLERLAAATSGGQSPFEILRLSAIAYLREAETSVELQRIGLGQSRAVLGWERWRELASQLGLGVTQALVAAAADSGEIEVHDVPATAHVVLGSMIEAAMLVVTARDRTAMRKKVEPIVLDLVDALQSSKARHQRPRKS